MSEVDGDPGLHPGYCYRLEHEPAYEAYHHTEISLRDKGPVGPAIRWVCPICRVWWDLPAKRSSNGSNART